MTNLITIYQKFSKGLTMLDRTIIKIDLIILGILLAKLFPVLTSLHRGWYVGFLVAAEIYFIVILKKREIV